jgi:hypothetical protein
MMTTCIQVPLLLQLKRSDPLYELKISVWRRDSALPSRRLRVAVGDNENYKMLLSLLRIIEADKDDVDQLLRKVSGSSGGSSSLTSFRSIRDAQTPINVVNEYRAMQHLESLCNSYLSKYQHTYETDCRRLVSDELPQFSNERHAVIQVKGEKEVLLFYREFAIVSQRLLRIRDMRVLEEEMLEVRATKHFLIYDHVKIHIHKLIMDDQQRSLRRIGDRNSSAASNRPVLL